MAEYRIDYAPVIDICPIGNFCGIEVGVGVGVGLG